MGVGRVEEGPEARKNVNKFVKKLNYKMVNVKNFSKIFQKGFAPLFKINRITIIFYCGRGWGGGEGEASVLLTNFNTPKFSYFVP